MVLEPIARVASRFELERLRERRREEGGIRNRRQADEPDAVRELIGGARRDFERETCLSDPSRPAESQHAHFGAQQHVCRLSDLGRPPHQGRCLRRQPHLGTPPLDVEPRIVIEDRALQFLQRCVRLDPQVADQSPTRLLIRLEGVGLAT